MQRDEVIKEYAYKCCGCGTHCSCVFRASCHETRHVTRLRMFKGGCTESDTTNMQHHQSRYGRRNRIRNILDLNSEAGYVSSGLL